MKQSFFERLTGTISLRGSTPAYEKEIEVEQEESEQILQNTWNLEEDAVGELTVDVYQTNDAIIIQTIVAGVDASDLSLSVTREMVTIKGKREAPKGVAQSNYFYQELYWGAFARTILLPSEIEVEDAEATEKHGLLTIKLPKLDKGRVQNVKIKSV